MAIAIRPGTGLPFAVIIADESHLGDKFTWGYLADWCTLLIGPIDELWSLSWEDGNGMGWSFKIREDAGLFNFTWKI